MENLYLTTFFPNDVTLKMLPDAQLSLERLVEVLA